VSSCIGTVGALCLLANRVNLPQVAGRTVIFVVLSSQMFYGTTAHIANDWLAVPLMVLLFERLIAAWENPGVRIMALLAATLAAGLLTKSYFIALIPFVAIVFGVLLLRRRLLLRPMLTFFVVLFTLAGPWYARNVLMYHNLSGMQETMGGVQLSALVASGTHLPWIRAGWGLLLGSLWTGNNSFRAFSRSTLVMLLLPFCIAAISWVYRCLSRSLATSEVLLMGGSLTYGMALAYSAAVTYWSSGGKGFSPEPWYAEAVAPILVTVLVGELTRYRFYWVIVAWIAFLSAYILGATYWVKLIPLYSGFPDGRSTLGRLASWYGNSGLFANRLSETALKGPALILLLAAAVPPLAFALALFLGWRWKKLWPLSGAAQ
jgi:hypothetical protein